MAFQPIYEKLKNDCVKKLAAGQTVVEARLSPEGDSKIAKVLSIAADGCVTGQEMLDKEAKVGGRVTFKVIYTDAAGDNHCVMHSADYSEKIAAEGITPLTKTHAYCHIIDVDTVSVGAGEIRLATVVETVLMGLEEFELDCLKAGGDGLYIRSEPMPCQIQGGSGRGEAAIIEEIDAGAGANRVLYAEADAIITEYKCSTDVIAALGKTVFNITVEKEGGAIETISRVVQFEQEIAAAGAATGDVARIFCDVARTEITLLDDDDKKLLRAEATVNINGHTFREAEFETVTDAFSITHETKCVTESVELSRMIFCRAFEEKVEGTATLETEMPAVDKILATTAGRVNVANVFAGEDKLTIEGVLNAGVIYFNAELNSLNSVQVELPYSIVISAPGMKESNIPDARGIILETGARVKKLSEVEVSARVVFLVCADETSTGLAITSVECGDERAAGNTAIAIYIVRKGETLWDVAKTLRQTPELILTQNPGMKLPLEGGERILLYHQLR